MNAPATIEPGQITTTVLIACGIKPTQAKAFEEPIQQACARFQINNTLRLAAFIGQCRVESMDFAKLEENLYYTTASVVQDTFKSRITSPAQAQSLLRNPQALANVVYANRFGNGAPDSGDGWRYRGRGLMHLTFKDNYRAAQMACNRPYVARPELVAQPADAALTAAWYWHSRNCNALADDWNIREITRAINPGMWGANQRLHDCNEAREALENIF